jgi:hypothetical protein
MMDTVEEAVIQTLRYASAAQADAVVDAVQRHEVRLEQLEASVRFDGPRVIRGGRMMVQRASPDLIVELDQALQLGHSKGLRQLARIAEADALSLIAGWDITPAGPMLKLYMNASDRAEAARSRVAARLGLRPFLASEAIPPHVFAFNFLKGSFETKVYWQSDTASARTVQWGEPARSIVNRFADVAAGFVLSHDLGEHGFEPRAFFIATAYAGRFRARELCRMLPGWSDALVDEELPFEPGTLRSLGVFMKKPSMWTAYFRPRVDDGERLMSLNPTVCLRLGAAEIGLFVEPAADGAPAAVRTARHALSYRIRKGAESGPAIDRVLRWAAERVARAEQDALPVAASLSAPPEPWVLVAA